MLYIKFITIITSIIDKGNIKYEYKQSACIWKSEKYVKSHLKSQI